jgi:hypothetical protein
MSLFTLYLLSILPGVGGLFSGLGVILIILCVIGFFMALVADFDSCRDGMKYKKVWANQMKKGWGVLIAAFLLIGVLIPSEKQLYFIAGGYVATNTEGVKELPDNIMNAANSWLENIADAAKQEVVNTVEGK